MRRRDRQVVDLAEIQKIVERMKVCRLAFLSDEAPYIVPLNFGCEWQDDNLTLYFHGAEKGLKMDLLAKNPSVGFEMDGGHEITLTDEDNACTYSYRFESVIGSGTARILQTDEEKRHGLLKLMEQQTGRTDFEFPHLSGVAVFAVSVKNFTAKRHL
ncbi:pyridoxamine 5'-phosphate oxidase family protein [Scatolibacter rhodanostii]|uniref:pyridoxamine 5'-phosphate oxidase family protein n=1 Tax=Scatolibacter rhodanostii TaxID=2014781 RepID=UPI000C077662|nr:pyridoxamine 5'-phosphate oxidase family protein [Scatolibacter rhodanostii]